MKPWLCILLLVCSIEAQAGRDRYIPHIVQGQGWATLLHVINLCDDPSTYNLDLIGSDGERLQFAFAGTEDRYGGVHNGADPIVEMGTHSFLLPDIGKDLIQGYGILTDDGGGCIAVDTEYRQRIPEFPFATVPTQQMSGDELILPFRYVGGCVAGVAMAGNGGRLRIKAMNWNGELLGQADLGNVYHTAFPLHDKIPGVQGQRGTLRIIGEAAAVGLDFCDGKLEQFRLPHRLEATEPPGAGQDDFTLTKNSYYASDFAVKFLRRETKTADGETYDQDVYGIKVTIGNVAIARRRYEATLTFLDESGFLLYEASLEPGGTVDRAFHKSTNAAKELNVPPLSTVTFFGNVGLYPQESEQVRKVHLTLTW